VNNAPEIAGRMVLIATVTAYLVYVRSRSRAVRNGMVGDCQRCGSMDAAAPEPPAFADTKYCLRCRSAIARNYRAAAWLFGTICVFFATTGAWIILDEYRRHGAHTAGQDASIIVPMTVTCGLVTWFLRYAARSTR
jgi:hypothetical protein